MKSNDKSTVKAAYLCLNSKELDVNLSQSVDTRTFNHTFNLITLNILSNQNSLEWESNAFEVLKQIGIL